MEAFTTGIRILLKIKKGALEEIDPFLSMTCSKGIITIWNSFNNYDYKVKDIETISFYKVKKSGEIVVTK